MALLDPLLPIRIGFDISLSPPVCSSGLILSGVERIVVRPPDMTIPVRPLFPSYPLG